jgi:hypothetical protein
MKKLLAAAAAGLLVFGTGIALADSHEGDEPRWFAPVEAWTCDYRDGKGPSDLEPVIDAWNAWMDDRDQTDYFAVTMVPHYYGENTFDIGWLGSWPGGAAMGKGEDLWLREGGEVAAGFFEIIDCDSHSNFATAELKEPGNESPPDNIVLAFSDCTVNEDAEWEAVWAGLEGWAAYQEEHGYGEGTWIMFPAYGGGGAEFDFKIVSGYDSHTEMGADYELYVKRADYLKYGELLGSLVECDDARVYNGTVRRRQEQ